MFTANQLVAHMIGDYIFQSHWMATKKTSSWVVASIHALTYFIPFLFLCSVSWWQGLLIVTTHAAIDRYRLARYVCWLKNGPWKPLTNTGFDDTVPLYLSVWLLIIADNVIHVILNGVILSL